MLPTTSAPTVTGTAASATSAGGSALRGPSHVLGFGAATAYCGRPMGR